MNTYDKIVVQYFLENQKQLFDEPVVATEEEALEFLEDCMATVLKNKKEVCRYFEECGIDIAGMSMQEILESSEVFAIPDGRYLIVES